MMSVGKCATYLDVCTITQYLASEGIDIFTPCFAVTNGVRQGDIIFPTLSQFLLMTLPLGQKVWISLFLSVTFLPPELVVTTAQ